MSVVGPASGCHLVLMDAFESETALALIERHGVVWMAVGRGKAFDPAAASHANFRMRRWHFDG